MRLDQIEIFIDVAQTLNFAETARRKELDPSQVSRAVLALETAVGAPLFIRTTRRMRLSQSGELFLPNARAALEALRAGQEDARASQVVPEGRVRLTASVAFGETLLVPLLSKLRQVYPAIIPEINLSDQVVDLMGQGFDLAIRLGPALTGDIIGRKLFDTRYLICATPEFLRSHPKLARPKDLGSVPVIAQDLPGHRDRWVLQTRSGVTEDVSIDAAIILSSALGVRAAALEHLGVALMADWLVKRPVSEGRLIPILTNYEASASARLSAAWLAYPAATAMPMRVRAVADFLIEELVG